MWPSITARSRVTRSWPASATGRNASVWARIASAYSVANRTSLVAKYEYSVAGLTPAAAARSRMLSDR